MHALLSHAPSCYVLKASMVVFSVLYPQHNHCLTISSRQLAFGLHLYIADYPHSMFGHLLPDTFVQLEAPLRHAGQLIQLQPVDWISKSTRRIIAMNNSSFSTMQTASSTMLDMACSPAPCFSSKAPAYITVPYVKEASRALHDRISKSFGVPSYSIPTAKGFRVFNHKEVSHDSRDRILTSSEIPAFNTPASKKTGKKSPTCTSASVHYGGPTAIDVTQVGKPSKLTQSSNTVEMGSLVHMPADINVLCSVDDYSPEHLQKMDRRVPMWSQSTQLAHSPVPAAFSDKQSTKKPTSATDVPSDTAVGNQAVVSTLHASKAAVIDDVFDRS